MATEREENLLLLIEVLTKEMFAIGQTCSDARWIGRYELARLARAQEMEFEELMDSNIVREYDQVLEKTVERLENIIRLAEERVNELTVARTSTEA